MIVLRFRHDGTTSEWQFDGADEQILRGMLTDLAPYSAEPGSDDGVLTADSGGAPIGAWTRGGAAHLASLMFRERRTSPWTAVEAAIQGEVMKPHAPRS